MKNKKINLYSGHIINRFDCLSSSGGEILSRARAVLPSISRSSTELVGTVMQLIKTYYLEEPNPPELPAGLSGASSIRLIL
jgi:hypothetical protein